MLNNCFKYLLSDFIKIWAVPPFQGKLISLRVYETIDEILDRLQQVGITLLNSSLQGPLPSPTQPKLYLQRDMIFTAERMPFSLFGITSAWSAPFPGFLLLNLTPLSPSSIQRIIFFIFHQVFVYTIASDYPTDLLGFNYCKNSWKHGWEFNEGKILKM